MVRATLFGICGAALLTAPGCAGETALTSEAAHPTAAPVVVAPAQRRPDTPLPAPTGPVVLTLTGNIDQRNGGDALRFDAALLDQLGLVRVAVYDPWVKQEIQLEGVWLNDLMTVVQPGAGVQGIHLTALDDYQVDLTMAEIRAGGILLATRTGTGEPIPIPDGGPVRVVFVGGVPSGASPDQWIWNVSKIDVR